MSQIDNNINSLEQFTQALKTNNSISCKKNGKWKYDTLITRFVQRLFGQDDVRIANIAKVFGERLDALEKIPALFNCSSVVEQSQKKKFKAYLSAALEVEKALSVSKKIECKEELVNLKQKVIGLKYRIESVNHGFDILKTPDPLQYDQIEKLASAWKKKQKMIPNQDKALTLSEKSQIQKTCLYSEFAALLSLNPKLQDDFFKWTLRDQNGVQQFIEFPATSQKLKQCHLSVRVGFFGGDLLSVKKKNIESKKPQAGQQKLVRLPFETEDGLGIKKVCILDDTQEVTLKGGWAITIKKVIDIFSNKKFEIGNLEFFGKGGFKNWNCQHLGWWNPNKGSKGEFETINFNMPQWWNQLPVFECITKAELEKRFELSPLQNNEWVAIPRSSRESLLLDITKSHGCIEVAIPQIDGTYRLIVLGKFASVWPRTDFEAFDFLAKTVKGNIYYPDESVFYTHRQHAGMPFVLNEQKGLELMNFIKEDLLKARDGNIIFQFTWENCSYWPQQLLNKLLGKASEGGKAPNLFITPLTTVTAPKPIRYIFDFHRSLPAKLQPKFIRLLEYLLNTNRGIWITENGMRVYKSTAKSDFRKEQKTYQPGFLHHQILQKKLKGVVWAGLRNK